LVVIVPSRDYQRNAGARIRYGRLIAAFAVRGIELTMEPIDTFDPTSGECDIVLFSKCHDARPAIMAHVLAQRGIRVGVDVFDDYFSQVTDSRLNRLRAWLSHILTLCDFALVSTPTTARLISTYAPAVPVHVLNDPAPLLDVEELADLLQDKRSEAEASGRLRVAWFGMGDNPHFALGLQDVAAFAAVLSALATGPFAVELTILTNRRSLDAAGLERIMSLPVATKVNEWTEEAEAALLRESLVAFLPVNANRFSRAKSLNRAVTALAAGCQVLSTGYPLYDPLAHFIYRTADELLKDFRGERFRLSQATLHDLGLSFAALASAAREVSAFEEFLGELAPPIPSRDALFVVHGASSTVPVHNLAKAVGAVSVASPFCAQPFDFDAVVEASVEGELALLATRGALARLSRRVHKPVRPALRIGGRKFFEVTRVHSPEQQQPSLRDADLPVQLAVYPSVMSGVRQLLADNFDAPRVLISETSPLPFEQPEGGNVHAA
jgi:hypothetical protein